MKRLRGIIHGHTIELPEGIELPDGTAVDVLVTLPVEQRTARLNAILSRPDRDAEWWTDQDDAILAAIAASRHQPDERELPE
jgi:hypothetical protein